MAVEDGRPFCPQCRAPQIHVQVATPVSEIDVGLNPAPDALATEIPQTGQFDRPNVTAGMMTAGSTMDTRIAVRAALKAGALGVFIGMIPVLGIALTGALAVFFYRRENGFVPPIAVAARLGGAAGIAVFLVNALFIIPIIVLHAQQDILKMAQRYGINTASLQFQASMHLFTPSGLAINFIGLLVLASVGGALASMFMRPRSPRV